jgi:RNA polymerase sigma-32 factor
MEEDAGMEPDDAEVAPELPRRKIRGLLEDKLGPGPESEKLARFDPLRRYLYEIGKYKPLDREEEHLLALRYRETGDHEAAYRLVTSNLRLVVKIALIYHKLYRNLLDLVQEGNVGLLQAVRRFDPYRGTRLPTYAAWWIKAYILKFLLDNARMVKVGTTNVRRKILMNLNREKRELEARGITPTAQLLAHNLGVEEGEILAVERGMSGPDVSLDAPVSADGDVRFGDTLQMMEEGIDEKLAQEQFRQMLQKKIEEFSNTLSERERLILHKRLIAEEPQTLQQIADMYGITREAVRVAEKKLIAKLKRYMSDSFKDLGGVEFHFGSGRNP